MDVTAAKQALRARTRASRARRSPAEREECARGLERNLNALVERVHPQTIAAFWPSVTEPPIAGWLDAQAAAGVDVLLPLSLPDRSLDWAKHERGALRTHPQLGVPEPSGEALGGASVQRASLMLVPAAAVDPRGGRCGWGLGYYDRLLAALDDDVPRFAVVFADEVVDAVPTDIFDMRVHGIVTPEAVRDAIHPLS